MKNPNRFDCKRLRLDPFIKAFFGGNATISIVVLALITIFLFREGAEFFPQNLQNLRLYRKAGLEYVGYMRDQADAHSALNRSLQDLRVRQITAMMKVGKTNEEAQEALAGFDTFASAFDSAADDLRGVVSDLTESVTAIKEKAKLHDDALEQRTFLLKEGKKAEADAVKTAEVDFAAELAPIRAALPAYSAAAASLKQKLQEVIAEPPALPVPEFQPRFQHVLNATRAYLNGFPATELKLKNWNPDAPVPWWKSITSFLFGTDWITNSFWQDWYGIIPLLSGSLLVAVIALVIAVPLGVCAAIYVSELARPAEGGFIKPYLEFISAIPSVVLGFFGIAVLGEQLRQLTHWHALSWISAFPISERLNAFTAGALLALMAIPTIFSLSEDALNAVPRHFKEASYALGATRLQTIWRVLVPASLSGIVSAVLLGFGRVIGETMVVLLCAGNRIAIPDFTDGLAVIFQPVHTMTGIVAQELGEVANGTLHYRALFMVGLFLFFLALFINWLAQAAVRKFKISIG